MIGDEHFDPERRNAKIVHMQQLIMLIVYKEPIALYAQAWRKWQKAVAKNAFQQEVTAKDDCTLVTSRVEALDTLLTNH